MNTISDYAQATYVFISKDFSNICLILGLFILITTTVQMKDDPDKTSNSDLYYQINVGGIVACGIFVLNHFIVPHLKYDYK